METNVILFFSAIGMIITLILGGIMGWLYKSTVDQHTLKRQMNNLHPEFLDGNGSYVNAVSYTHLTLPTKRIV